MVGACSSQAEYSQDDPLIDMELQRVIYEIYKRILLCSQESSVMYRLISGFIAGQSERATGCTRLRLFGGLQRMNPGN